MPLLPIKDKVSTVLFRIPHINNLLCFKGALNSPDALVSVFSEILKLGDPDLLYIGYDEQFTLPKEVLLQQHDSVIVRMTFPGKKIICKDPQQTIGLAVTELQRINNRISVASDKLSREKNITAIAMSVVDLQHPENSGRIIPDSDT